jgi:hypothetical protein
MSVHKYFSGKLFKSSFQRNKQHLFWASKSRVMTVLVETAQKAKGLREFPMTINFVEFPKPITSETQRGPFAPSKRPSTSS